MKNHAGSILKTQMGQYSRLSALRQRTKGLPLKNGKTFKCAHCGKQFKVTTGTIYENSNIPLQKWFLTFYLISLSKKGISSMELSKTIGITQKSAWYLLHKIRYMLEHRNSDNQLRGTVEVDETYIGGKKRVNVVVALKTRHQYSGRCSAKVACQLHQWRIPNA